MHSLPASQRAGPCGCWIWPRAQTNAASSSGSWCVVRGAWCVPLPSTCTALFQIAGSQAVCGTSPPTVVFHARQTGLDDDEPSLPASRGCQRLCRTGAHTLRASLTGPTQGGWTNRTSPNFFPLLHQHQAAPFPPGVYTSVGCPCVASRQRWCHQQAAGGTIRSWHRRGPPRGDLIHAAAAGDGRAPTAPRHGAQPSSSRSAAGRQQQQPCFLTPHARDGIGGRSSSWRGRLDPRMSPTAWPPGPCRRRFRRAFAVPWATGRR